MSCTWASQTKDFNSPNLHSVKIMKKPSFNATTSCLQSEKIKSVTLDH